MISPDRLAALIAGWTHEAEVAEANQRADEYANTCRDTAEALRQLDDKVALLKSQLPLGMAHCVIVFNECTLGHGWLSATNWVQHECPTCSLNAARLRAETAEKELRKHDLYKMSPEQRMVYFDQISAGYCTSCGRECEFICPCENDE